jgi:hypothetical protein
MNKKVRSIILSTWIGITSSLDLCIGILSFSIIAYINYAENGSTESTLPIYVIALTQIIISLLVLLFGVVWASIILLATEKLLFSLKFPTPGNNKFSKLSLGLFKLALTTIAIALLLGNINLVYNQLQGRAIFKYN